MSGTQLYLRWQDVNQSEMTKLEDVKQQMSDLEHQHIYDAIQDLKTTMLPRSEFRPVRNIVYGMVEVIMLSVLNSLLGNVVEAAKYFPEIVGYLRAVVGSV